VIEDLGREIAAESRQRRGQTVRRGIVLSVENIQFEAESSDLSDPEKKKVDGIGKTAHQSREPETEYRRTCGETSPGQTKNELLALSAARAKSVADYLVKAGFRTSDSVVSSGMGGTKPLAG
jgi:outer membrane protein OmpA-like peptidoglycan-associated protein